MTGIPQVIHRLWLGPRPMPQRFKDYGRDWETLNPGWECHDWSWHDLPEDLANADIMDDTRRRSSRSDSIELATALADIIDYELIARFGGVYVNTDMQPVRPLPPELHEGEAWAARETDNRIVNAAMGGPPGHPFWQVMVDQLAERYWRMRGQGNENIVELTGPCYLSDMLMAIPEEERIRVAAKEVFCPVDINAVARGQTADGLWTMDTLPPDTVAVHHWDHRRTGRPNEVR